MGKKRRRPRVHFLIALVLLAAPLLLVGDLYGPRLVMRHLLSYAGPGLVVADGELPFGHRIDVFETTIRQNPYGGQIDLELDHIPKLAARCAIAIPMDVERMIDLMDFNCEVHKMTPETSRRMRADGEMRPLGLFTMGLIGMDPWKRWERPELGEVWFMGPSCKPISQDRLRHGATYLLSVNVNGRFLPREGAPDLPADFEVEMRFVLW